MILRVIDERNQIEREQAQDAMLDLIGYHQPEELVVQSETELYADGPQGQAKAAWPRLFSPVMWGIMSMFILVLLVSATASQASAQLDQQKVLVIHSYYFGYKWTDDEMRGIVDVLQAEGNIDLRVEYLDAKRISHDEYFAQLYRVFQQKYKDVKLDLVMVTDDAALNFVLEHADSLFPGVPVVFAGANYFDETRLEGHDLFTGISEDADLRGTINTALQLHPDTTRVVVVNDATNTGQLVRGKLDLLVPNYPSITFDFVEDMSMVEVQEYLQTLPPDTIVLLTFFFQDKDGAFFEYDVHSSLIAQSSAVPIYAVWDFSLGFGVIGGKLTSGYTTGKNLSNLALRILNGENPGDIPVDHKLQSLPIFDYNAMERFGIKITDLPDDSYVINRPVVSFYEEHKHTILGVSTVIALLVFVVIFLGISNSQRRRAQLKLAERNYELQESEDRFRTIFDVVNDAIFVHDASTGEILDVNQRMCEMFGYTHEEALKLSVGEISSGEPGYTLEDAIEWIGKALGGQAQLFEWHSKTKSGRLFWSEVNMRCDEIDGQERVLVTVRDISERAQAQEHIRRNLARAQGISRAAAALNRAHDLDTIFEAIIEHIDSVLPYEVCDLLLLDGDQSYPVWGVDLRGGKKRIERWPERPPFSIADTPDLRAMASSRSAYFIEDTRAHEGWIIVPERAWVRATAGVGLYDGDHLNGFVIAASSQPGIFDPAESEYLQAFADLAGVSLTKARLHQDQIQRATELTSLNTLRQKVSQSLSIERVIPAGIKGMVEAVHPDLAFFFLRDGDRLIQKSIFPPQGKIRMGAVPEHRVGECMCGLAVREKKALYSKDIYEDMRCTWEECKKAGTRSFAALPLLSGEKVIGVIGLASDEERDFEAQAEFLETLSHTVAVSLSNALHYEQIQQHSTDLEQRIEERTVELQERVSESDNLNRAMIAISEDLQAAVEKAKSADQLKSAFLATMSHELRTPLNSIIGFTGILKQGLTGPLTAEQEKQLGMIQISARHLLDLINDVLDISKIEAGQLEISRQLFDMRALIDKVVEIVKPLAEKNGLALTCDVAHGVDQIVSDQRRVEQVLINLVNNAIKFTDEGEVRIECEIRDDWLMTSVIDTGIGIKPEDVQQLFAAFRQIETGLNRQYEGTGLGLSISQKLIDLLGGEIWVESEWGEGSTFRFSIPLKK